MSLSSDWNLVNILIQTQHILTHIFKRFTTSCKVQSWLEYLYNPMQRVQYKKSCIFTLNQENLSDYIHFFRSLQDLRVISEKTNPDNKTVSCNRDFVLDCSSKIMCHPVAKSYFWQYVYIYTKHTANVKNCTQSGLTNISWSLLIISPSLVSDVIIFYFYSFATF